MEMAIKRRECVELEHDQDLASAPCTSLTYVSFCGSAPVVLFFCSCSHLVCSDYLKEADPACQESH